MVTVKSKKRHHRKTRKVVSFYKQPPKLIIINGYYLLLLPLKQSSSLRIDCNIFGGSILENRHNSGIAHILEHIIMSAWKRCGNLKCSLYLEKYGMISNASTHKMFTSYWAKCLPQFGNIILDYIFDIIFHPKITQELLNSEKKIVKNELEGYLNVPSWELNNQISKALYKSNGLRFSEDYRQQINVLDNLTIKMLEAYINRSRLERCVMFTISGDFNRQEIISYFRKKLQKTKPNRFRCQMLSFNPQLQCFTMAKKVIFVKNPKAENTEISISFPTDIKKGSKYSMLLPFVNEIVASDLTSLLVKRLRLELNLVYGVSIYPIQNLCGTSIHIGISTQDINILEVLKETFEILSKYSEEFIPNNTLLNEKRKYALFTRQISNRNPNVVSSFYTSQYFWQLNKKHRKIYTLEQLHKEIRHIDHTTIMQIIQKIFNTNHCIVGYIGKKQVDFTTANF